VAKDFEIGGQLGKSFGRNNLVEYYHYHSSLASLLDYS
jgi:hypothetical protein